MQSERCNFCVKRYDDKEYAPYCSSYCDIESKIEKFDNINPKHYRSHKSSIQCIQITEHMSFCLGNAIKYIWRADLKHDAIEDLKKAIWYLTREIEKRERK